jgi:ATP-dependent DNA helicase RecG
MEGLLKELDERQADDLEDQYLDFKQWTERSMDDSVRMVVDMAVCMANGGGGTVVFGVKSENPEISGPGRGRYASYEIK